ncbi:hypothetical protein F4054_15510 [Candidatus Poribacteria bacterium]|nr:hypothetical protein [Candidatus Poribacteria bacterium]MYG08718.1 hypothetical protein [Candidatus Poribacteria bacterium]MYK23649.1 hypothetical protein [Candidatus Poribacteria bacterium]
MINLSSMRSRNRRTHIISIPILAISILLATIFIASCGDEGDTPEDTTGMTDVLQPTTTPSETPSPPPADELPPAEEVVEEPGVSFKDDIQPILAERCAVPGCHVAGHFTGLDLSKYDAFKKGGNRGPGFVAGDGKGSLVVEFIDGGGMPPGGPPLDGDQIQLFIDWIDEGAENN